MSDGRSLGWCFTINNPTEDDSLEPLTQAAQYVIAGKEVGENGTPHLQGYAFFKTKKSLKQLKVLLPRAHLEKQKGSFEQAIDYCKKDGDFHEVGISPMSKKRKGECGAEYWEDIKKKAKSGDLDQIDPKVFVTHFNTLQKIAATYAPMPPDEENTTGEWLWGPTGTGKSLYARSQNPSLFLKPCNKWWCGYQGEDAVLIEDFDTQHHMLGYFLKIWADRYAFPAEVKGGKINIRPKKIIITSNYHPSDIWGAQLATLDPIQRRFKIIYFDKVRGPEPERSSDTPNLE